MYRHSRRMNEKGTIIIQKKSKKQKLKSSVLKSLIFKY